MTNDLDEGSFFDTTVSYTQVASPDAKSSADVSDGGTIADEGAPPVNGCPFTGPNATMICDNEACLSDHQSDACSAAIIAYCASYPDDPGCANVRGQSAPGPDAGAQNSVD